ncbi:hypothetical protein LguiB_020946 [Lonicera macranthoides]
MQGTKTVEGLTLDMRMLNDAGNNAKKRRYEELRDKSILSKHVSSLKRRCFSLISGQSFLGSLKILDLSYSEQLARTPNFLGLPNLERLILKGCVSLVEVCESIGNLELLDLLDLEDCKTLRKLPRNIGKLGSLKTLVILGCNIVEWPSEMINMESLEVLNADGIIINPLHSSSWKVKWWQPIVWSFLATPTKGLETLWASLPFSLRELSMSGCKLCDDSFPDNFGNLPLLSRLNLSANPFHRLPNCIKSLSGLNFLFLYECHWLQSLELNGLSMKSGWIDAINCRSLEKIMSPNGSIDLFLHGCYKLVELEDCFMKEDHARENRVQGTFEYGIFSIYPRGGAIPTFSGEKCEGSSICFTVPYSLPTHRRIQYLNVWCMCENTKKVSIPLPWIYMKIENKTKDLTWIYCPTYFTYDEYMTWLSRWRFGNQLEAGDDITITFDGKDIYLVKECGFKILYHSDEEEEQNGSSSSSLTVEESSHHDFQALRLSTGEYFLCKRFEENPDQNLWFPQ